MTHKFKVGDAVKYLGGAWFKEGEKLTVTENDGDDWRSIKVDSGKDSYWVNAEEIELIKPKKNARISALEKQVAELIAKVEALESTQKPAVSVIQDAIAFYNAKSTKMTPLTPNEQRKAIIDEAKAFVYEYAGVILNNETPLTSKLGDTKIKLYVNEKKRTVTAIPYLVHVKASDPSRKKIVKCAPDDVFNAYIGKAIALGRALGLDVKRFEQAVNPNEVVGGMVAKCIDNFDNEYVASVVSGLSAVIHSEKFLKLSPNKLVAILEDTDAQY